MLNFVPASHSTKSKHKTWMAEVAFIIANQLNFNLSNANLIDPVSNLI